MNRSERVGFWIVVGVFTLLEGAILAFAVVVPAWLFFHEPSADWAPAAFLLPVMAGVSLPGLVYAVRGFWRGHEAGRWFGFLGLAVCGAGIIGTAVWMTTLDYPDAETPAVRAEMKADDRRQLPWRVGQGLIPIAAGLLLLSPPVGHFLGYRRRTVEASSAGTPVDLPC